MKWITIIEKGNNEAPNVGTISTNDLKGGFKKAIQSHFDADLVSYELIGDDIESLSDCINSCPIDVNVVLDVNDGDKEEYKVELSQTWMY